MKHNKKRNTAFLYECLIRELTKAILKEDIQRQSKVKGLLKEFYTIGKLLSKELGVYKSLWVIRFFQTLFQTTKT